MSRSQAPEPNRQILEEASAWFVEFRFGEIDARARREFMDWLRRSPEHIRAYIDISGTYARLPNRGQIDETAIDRLIESTRERAAPVALDPANAGVVQLPVARDVRVDRSGTWKRALLAASIAVIAIAGIVAGWISVARAPEYATEVGEHRSIVLEDGTRVNLNALSRIRISLSPDERHVDLVEGQALFQVAKDTKRPFVVSSGGVRVRALGTRFDVYRLESGTTVTVLEGRVAVEPPDDSSITPSAGAGVEAARASGSSVELGAGEQVVVTSTAIQKPPRVNASSATAWLQGQLEFNDTPLADVAREFNRYNRRPLVIESPALGDFRVSGIYSSGDPQTLIRFLRNQNNVLVTETDTEIRISAQ